MPMKKKWKKLKGFENLISSIVAMTVLMSMMLFYVSAVAEVEKQMEISVLGRRYIMQMETKGFLSAEDGNRLKNELDLLGVYDLSFEGTTLSPAGYNKTVILSVQGKRVTNKIVGYKDFEFIRDESGFTEVGIYKKGTAKY